MHDDEHRHDEAYEENNKFPHKTTKIRKPCAKVQSAKHQTDHRMSYQHLVKITGKALTRETVC